MSYDPVVSDTYAYHRKLARQTEIEEGIEEEVNEMTREHVIWELSERDHEFEGEFTVKKARKILSEKMIDERDKYERGQYE